MRGNVYDYLTDTRHVPRLLGNLLPIWRGRFTHVKHQQEVGPELLSDILEMVAVGNLGNWGTFAFHS